MSTQVTEKQTTGVHREIPEKFFLVLYDFCDTPSGNSMRNEFRDKLKGFGAMQMTQSCYLIPESVTSKETVELYAEEKEVDIRTFGLDVDRQEERRLSNDYRKHLIDILDEVKSFIQDRWDELLQFENETADAKNLDEVPTLRGWYKKIDSIKARYEEMQELISRWGKKHDAIDFQMMTAFVEKISKRYESAKTSRDKRIIQLK